MIKTVTVKEAFEKKLWEDSSVHLFFAEDEEEAKTAEEQYIITEIDDDMEDDGVISYSVVFSYGNVIVVCNADDKLIVMPSYTAQTRIIEELEARYENLLREFYNTEWQLALEFWASDDQDKSKLEKQLNERWKLK